MPVQARGAQTASQSEFCSFGLLFNARNYNAGEQGAGSVPPGRDAGYNGGMDTVSMTLSEAREALARGEMTPEALTEACLQQMERLNPKINAFITITAEGARRQAAQLSTASKRPLCGLPVALKDLYDTAGVRTTAGTRFF